MAALATVEPQLNVLAEDIRMPNSELPVVHYRGAISGEDIEHFLYRKFKLNDWDGCWTDGIFGYHHFHCNAHEALGVVAGEATLKLGGDSGVTFEVEQGDVVVLPAGTGHRRIRATADFLVVGAYPKGQEKPNEYLDRANCGNYRNRLRAVPLPKADPLYGDSGPLI